MSGTHARLVLASGDVFRLDPSRGEIAIGRLAGNDLSLDEDSVSRIHATLVWRSSGWILTDVHSMNGTRVESSDRRVDLSPGTSCALHHGDQIRFGSVRVDFEEARGSGHDATKDGRTPRYEPNVVVTPGELAIVQELARPFAAGGPPASNAAIAEALSLSEEAVRSHLKSLYKRFDLSPRETAFNHQQRRVALASQAHRARSGRGDL